jgi:hypothetical protein
MQALVMAVLINIPDVFINREQSFVSKLFTSTLDKKLIPYGLSISEVNLQQNVDSHFTLKFKQRNILISPVVPFDERLEKVCAKLNADYAKQGIKFYIKDDGIEFSTPINSKLANELKQKSQELADLQNFIESRQLRA